MSAILLSEVRVTAVGCRRTCCRRTSRLEFSDFLGMCHARKLKIRTVWIIVRKIFTLYCIEGHHLFADKNVNRLESRKLGTAPGYDAGPHVLWQPTVLYRHSYGRYNIVQHPEIHRKRSQNLTMIPYFIHRRAEVIVGGPGAEPTCPICCTVFT